MRILILGAKGLLGQELARVFGDAVIGWDIEQMNLLDIKNQKSKIKSQEANLIVNAAAYTDVDGAERNVELANKINGYSVGDLAAICQDLNVPMVHFSTEYVFDGEVFDGYEENALPKPISVYGNSKLIGERELQKNTEKYYLIRLSRLFGTSPPPSPQSGEGVKRKKSFVELMLELSKNKKEIEVVDEELSSPSYALDIAQKAKYIIDNKLSYGIYHVANSGACTWYEFAKEIFKIAKRDVKLIPVPASRFPRLAKRPKYSILLNTKLPPMRTWQDALAEFMNQ